MRDEHNTDPLSIYNGRDERARSGFDSSDDAELRALFQKWSVPERPRSLDARITQSYRQQVNQTAERQEVFMKHCSTCQEEFANKFSFCPVDGTPLNEPVANIEPTAATIPSIHFGGALGASAALIPAGAEYHLTFLDDTGLTRRLMGELKEVAHNSELTWPEFKRDPFGYSGRFVKGYSGLVWRFFSSRNVAIATSTALLVVLTAIIAVIVVGRHQAQAVALAENDMMVTDIINTNEMPPDAVPKFSALERVAQSSLAV